MNSWYGATGHNPWDINKSNTTPEYTGTAAGPQISAPQGRWVVQVTGSPGWTTNQWAKYSINRAGDVSGGVTTGETHSGITSSTTNTLTYANNSFGEGSLKFATGDTVQIWKVNQAFDMPGVSGGQVLTFSKPIPVTPPAGWNDQIVDPCYSWNNTRTDVGGTANLSGALHTPLIENVHYYNNVPTGSAAPTGSCTPKAGYWATGVGEWDSTSSGADGQFYVCGPGGTWALHHKPYIYPHPLATGVTPSGKLISVSPTVLDFSNVIVGTIPAPTMSFTVGNIGDTTLTVNGVAYPGIPNNMFIGPAAGFTLTAGQTQTITVTFNPASATSYSGNITITSNADNGTTKTVAVSGVGQAPGPSEEDILLKASRSALLRR
jgi:hypothetical protein